VAAEAHRANPFSSTIFRSASSSRKMTPRRILLEAWREAVLARKVAREVFAKLEYGIPGRVHAPAPPFQFLRPRSFHRSGVKFDSHDGEQDGYEKN
jgi:hypothetical protein